MVTTPNRTWMPVVALTLLGLSSGCAPDINDPTFAPAMPAITAPTEPEIRDSIARGVRYLVDTQYPDGHWGSLGYHTNVLMPSARDTASFEMASNALVIKALIETDDGSPDVQAAIVRGEDWFLTNVATFRRPDLGSTFNNWAHLYAIEALITILERRPLDDERRQLVRRLVADHIRLLTASRTIRGGWGYYEVYPRTRPPSNWALSFITAAALVSLHEAKAAGFDVPKAATATGLKALSWSRLPNGAFAYHVHEIVRPALPASWPPGAVGRTQACNLAYWLYGNDLVTPAVMKGWLARLFHHGDWMDTARKAQVPHSTTSTPSSNRRAPFVIAGYYYYFAHYYAARVIEHLDPADRPAMKAQLARVLIDRQDQDGCWWDFLMQGYEKSYGTAYALMSLQRCLPEAEPE